MVQGEPVNFSENYSGSEQPRDSERETGFAVNPEPYEVQGEPHGVHSAPNPTWFGANPRPSRKVVLIPSDHDGRERETGFEPATFSLARRRSTAELLPHG